MTANISRLAQGMCPDLSYTALHISRSNNSVTVSDLTEVSRALQKVKVIPNKVYFGQFGSKEELQVDDIGDTSYKYEKRLLVV